MTDGRKTVLLVEDEAIVALNEKAVLERHGYIVLLAHSGEEAVRTAASGAGIDLILMDIDLGRGMDGTEAARLILREREIPVVFLSSHTEPEIVEKTEGITSYGYIVKNSGETVLRTSISMAFRLYEARVSESRKTDALRKSEEKYRALVENMNDIVYAMDLEGRFTYLSPGLERISGYTTAELIGRKFSDLVYPDDLPRLIDDFKKIVAGGVEPHEFRVVDRDGSVICMRTSSRSVTTGGVVTGITGIMTDITRHRQVEEDLLLKSKIFDQIKDFVTITDLEGAITYVNQASVDLFGRPRDGMIGQKIDIFGENPERGATQREILESTLRDGLWRGEVINIAADGSEHVMEGLTQVVTDEAGKPVALFGIANDVTDRKLAEAALFESEEKFRTIADFTYDWEYWMGNNGMMEYLSPSCERITGYSPVDFFNDPGLMENIIHPDDREAMMRHLGESLDRSGMAEENQIDFRIVKKDGSIAWIGHRCQPVFGSDGRRLGVRGSNRDITEYKRAEQLLRAERDLALLLAGAVSVQEAARFGLSAAISAAGMDSGGVYLFNDAGGLDLAVHEGLSDRFLKYVDHYAPDSNSVKIVLAGSPVFVDDSGVTIGSRAGALPPAMQARLSEEGLQALAVLPMHIKGEVVGCMNLGSRVHRILTPHARMVLESMSSHLGSAIFRMKIQQSLISEKELLLKEVHHRIKNNMGTIISLLSMQSDALRGTDAASALNDAIGRVQSMKVLYDRLYQSTNLREMSCSVYLSPLLDDIVSLFPGSRLVTIEREIEDFPLGVKVLSPLGIILNELVTNAMKYAFPGDRKGTIRLTAAKKGTKVTILVEDDGRGLPADFDIMNPSGFGLQLVSMLVAQLRGTIRVETGAGTRFVIEFDAA